MKKIKAKDKVILLILLRVSPLFSQEDVDKSAKRE